MQHTGRVCERSKEQNPTTQSESSTPSQESNQNLREDSIHVERDPGETVDRSVMNGDQEEDQPQCRLDGG